MKLSKSHKKDRKKLMGFRSRSWNVNDEKRGQGWKKGLARKVLMLWRKNHIIHSPCHVHHWELNPLPATYHSAMNKFLVSFEAKKQVRYYTWSCINGKETGRSRAYSAHILIREGFILPKELDDIRRKVTYYVRQKDGWIKTASLILAS